MIALEANEWKQERRDAQEEQRILQGIADRLLLSKFQHDRGVNQYTEVLEAAERLLAVATRTVPRPERAQLDQDIFLITDRFLFGQSNATHIYDELIGSGQMGLLSSPDLRNAITQLKVQLELLASYEAIQTGFVDTQLSPFLNEYVDRMPGVALMTNGNFGVYEPWKTFDLTALNFDDNKQMHDELLANRQFSNLLFDLIRYTRPLMGTYERIGGWIEQIDSITKPGNASIDSPLD